jgi:hypothetical protein
MQVSQAYKISDENYLTLFSDEYEIVGKYAEYFGVFSKKSVAWEFEHNNFREYLAAKYMQAFSFDKILEIITYGTNETELRPSWVNVVAYLLSLQENDGLLKWLLEHAKDKLCDMDADKISTEIKDEIFIGLMNDAISKKIGIWGVVDTHHLAEYYQSAKTIDYLIGVLNEDPIAIAITNALTILRDCVEFYNQQETITKILWDKVIKYPETSDYQKSLAIEIMLTITNDNGLESTASDLFDIIKDNKSNEVFVSFCKFIVKAKATETYLDYVFNNWKSRECRASYRAHKNVTEAFSDAITTYNGTKRVIEYILEDQEYSRRDYGNDLFNDACKKAAEFYKEGETDIFDIITDRYIKAVPFLRKRLVALSEFFIETETVQKLIKTVIDANDTEIQKWYKGDIFDRFMDESVLNLLANKYRKSSNYDDIFKWYISILNEDSEAFKTLSAIATEKGEYISPRPPTVNWEERNRKGYQKFFDSLFRKETFMALINEYLEFVGNSDIRVSEIFDAERPSYDDCQSLQEIRFCLNGWFNNDKHKKLKVADILAI